MKKIKFSFPILFAGLILLLANCTQKPEPKPNIVFLVAEDLSPRLGCYGDTIAKTPNLDQLAAEGQMFRNTYANCAICNPSRTSLITGLRPETTGIIENFYHVDKFISDSLPLLHRYLRENGYTTARFGKIMHHADETGWNIADKAYGDPQDKSNAKRPEKPVSEYIKHSADTLLYRFLGSSLLWGDSGNDPEQENDMVRTQKAIEFINKEHENPFFLAVGFHYTHLPFLLPQSYIDRYNAEMIPPAHVIEGDLEDIPGFAYWAFQHEDDVRTTDKEKSEIKQAFYGMISYLDDRVGEIVDAVNKRGISDNTIIVFISDHGYALGEHHLWRKETLFEESLRIPMIIKAPGITKPATVNNNLVELVDLYPTFVDLCGLPIPEHVEGTSLLPSMLEPQKDLNYPVYAIVKQGDRINETIGRAIRVENWKYHLWDDPDATEELYNLETDPQEFHNLADDEEYDAIKQELKAKLLEVKLNDVIYRMRGTILNEPPV